MCNDIYKLIAALLILISPCFAQSKSSGSSGAGSALANGYPSESFSSPVTLDIYGGRTDKSCTNPNAYMILTKIGNRWYFCDALQHPLISMSVGNTTPNSGVLDCNSINTNPIDIAKYGDTNYNWGSSTVARLKYIGFNSIGQDSVNHTLPYDTCGGSCPPSWPTGKQPNPVPYIYELRPAQDAAINAIAALSSAVKDLLATVSPAYTPTYRRTSVYDVFDPNVANELVAEVNRTDPNDTQIRANNPYLLGIFTDDSDFFSGSGAGPDFPAGHTNGNLAFVALITSPVETFNISTSGAGKAFLYTPVTMLAKAQATNPVTTCNVTNPCSLRDYLWQKYSGTISSLNTAWGSNYTSFDSTGTQVSGEQPTGWTGNGTTTVFTGILAHTPISPYSIQISVAGTVVSGDCPWFFLNGAGTKSCGTSLTSGHGTIGSPTVNFMTLASSTINYTTGAIQLTFVTAPANGAAITVNYIFGGWMAGGTGLMDESGGTGSQAGCPGSGTSTCWVGTNPTCVEGADSNYPNFFSCSATGGNPSPNANATVGADLDNWIPQYSGFYFKSMKNALRTKSQVPYLGLDTIGSWGEPAFSKFLQGAGPYVDGSFTQLYYDIGTITTGSPYLGPQISAQMYSYETRYLGDVPLLDFFTLTGTADSAESCHSPVTFSDYKTQPIRASKYYDSVNYFLNTPSFNSTYQFVGFNFWSFIDFANQNQGLVSVHDNYYDGVQGSRAVMIDPVTGATTFPESADYGNQITPILRANLLWLFLQ